MQAQCPVLMFLIYKITYNNVNGKLSPQPGEIIPQHYSVFKSFRFVLSWFAFCVKASKLFT